MDRQKTTCLLITSLSLMYPDEGTSVQQSCESRRRESFHTEAE